MIGKVHRLGLQGRATPSRPKRIYRRTSPFKTVKGVAVVKVTPRAAPVVTEEMKAASVAWDDLRRDQCAWILGETDGAASRCCGAPVDPDAADFQSRARYCAAHGALAVAEVRTRREVKPRGAGHDYRERGSPSLFDRSAMGGLKIY